ncbi:prepilin peptidase [Candidatus Woesearchaeota archaeon]|nr:prepilin peptidase [Candidatus Woesearchaeota archaeon]
MLDLIYAVCLVALVAASIADLRKREVPDWLNYSLLMSALGIRLIYSIATGDFSHITDGAAGAILFLAFALLMFYTGQWGGGDSKMIIALGAVLGLNVLDFGNILDSMLVKFFIFSLLAGAVYGAAWSFLLAARNKKRFLLEWNMIGKSRKTRTIKLTLLILLLSILIASVAVQDSFVRIPLLSLGIALSLGSYLWLFVKAVEKSCMLKYVRPKELTEGDWIEKEIRIKGKYICGPKDLGIEEKQIKQLIKLRVRKVLIKVGIPFVPSFLLGFVLAYTLRNIVLFGLF